MIGIDILAMLPGGKIVKRSFKGAFFDEAKHLEEQWFAESGAELVERKIFKLENFHKGETR